MDISRRKFLGSIAVSGFAFISTDSLFLEENFIETNEFSIGINDKDSRDVRMLQISDLHLADLSWSIQDLTKRVNQIDPDLILFTGDMIEKSENLYQLDKFLKLLNPDTQKIAVMGNWEYASEVNFKKLDEMYRDNKCDLLVNESKTYVVNGKRLTVTGVDDMLEGTPDFLAAVTGCKPENNHIVLSHCPEYRDHIQKEVEKINANRPAEQKIEINYMFSGHSHGGQVTIFGYAPFLPTGVGDYVRGWYKGSLPELYVSKGIGTSILPIRFGARAEISVFNYHLA